jgi:peptide/nickel transport system substrate-binding protein
MTIDRRRFLARSAALGGLALSPFPAHAQAPRRGGTLKLSVDQAVGKLNPLLTRVNPEYMVAELLYSSLTRLKPDMTAEPDLALSWTNSPDLTEWAFALRRGLTFHDGSACTAADVVATFEAILDAKTASPARQNVGPIAKVTAKDPNTVVFTLSSPFADLPVTLAYTNAKIVPAAIIKSGNLARLDREAIGTGPFKLVSYEPDRQVVVARNDNFYDKARPYLDRIQIVV